MHELPAIKEIHEIVLDHARAAEAIRVLSVELEIGALSDLQDEWVCRYFDHLGRGTLTEGASVKIHRVPGVLRCHGCGVSFKVESLPGDGASCPQCNSDAVSVASGRAIKVNQIEVV